MIKVKVENNLERPAIVGYYLTEDSNGAEIPQYWNGSYWSSTTGHPVVYWFRNPEEPTDKEIERMLEQHPPPRKVWGGFMN